MKRLAIIGSGDLGHLIAYHAKNDSKMEVVGFFDDFQKEKSTVHGIPILGKIQNITESFENNLFDCLINGVGYKHMSFRKEIFNQFFNIIPFANIIHSSAIIDPSVKMGSGVFVLPGCVLDQNTELGNNTLLNTSVTIAHDSKIGDHCFLSPRVAIAGKVRINESCIVGINSTIIDHVTVVSNTQIAGGAVIIKDISQPGLYAGVPAKWKKNK
jgi:sugar O-acyltransferase (sialic acid O-acetyltransferase NeuD family)